MPRAADDVAIRRAAWLLLDWPDVEAVTFTLAGVTTIGDAIDTLLAMLMLQAHDARTSASTSRLTMLAHGQEIT